MNPKDIYKINETMDNTWEDGEEIVNALIRFIGDAETIIRILKEDLACDKYECDASTWSDLAYCIIEDVAWETKPYNDSDYIIELEYIRDDEEACKELLTAHNWCIDTETGVAICFDDCITPICHEYRK